MILDGVNAAFERLNYMQQMLQEGKIGEFIKAIPEELQDQIELKIPANMYVKALITKVHQQSACIIPLQEQEKGVQYYVVTFPQLHDFIQKNLNYQKQMQNQSLATPEEIDADLKSFLDLNLPQMTISVKNQVNIDNEYNEIYSGIDNLSLID